MSSFTPTTIQFKRGTAANLATVNPFLEIGEPCFEYDTGRVKVGDGVHSWNDLPYQENSGPVGPPGPTGPIGATGPQGPSVVNIDGGTPASNYGGIDSIDAGGI